MAAVTQQEGTLPIGYRVSDHYEIRGFLGQGATGEVYEAVDGKGERFALKVLHPHLSEDPDIVARFERESSLAYLFRSPYVAAVAGSGEDASGRLWIAFEHLVGRALDARLRESRLPIVECRPVGEGILRGLVDAHKAGIIHRDVKPSNVFLESTGRTRLLDFGIARTVRAREGGRSSSGGLTAVGEGIGTLNYMPPEQLKDAKNVTPRADIYAAAATLYRALTLRLPFEGETSELLAVFKRRKDALSLEQSLDVPWSPLLEEFFRICLSRDPVERFDTSAAALAAWLRACESAA